MSENQSIPYSEKLKDPRWQKKRLEIFERDAWTCRLCSSTKKTLCVHHKKYSYGKNPWEYDNEDLITYCEECHRAFSLMEERYNLFMKAENGKFKELVSSALVLTEVYYKHIDPQKIPFWLGVNTIADCLKAYCEIEKEKSNELD